MRSTVYGSTAIELLCGSALFFGCDGARALETGNTGAGSDSEADSAESSADEHDPDESATSSHSGETGQSCRPGIGDCSDGLKCQPYVSEVGNCCVDNHMCVPITGDQQSGEACFHEELGDDCAKDLFCLAATSATVGPGFCLQLCDESDVHSCEVAGLDRDVCVSSGDGVLPHCVPTCHPLHPDCAEGEGCYRYHWYSAQFTCWPSDVEPGQGEDGDPCQYERTCEPGLACEWSGALQGCESRSESCCTPFCDIDGDGSECEDPEECFSLFDANDPPFLPDLANVGICRLPEDG